MPPRVKPSNAKSTKLANGVEHTKISALTDDDDAVSSTNITNEEPEQKLTKAKAKPKAKNAKAAAATSAPATDDISEKKITKATNGRSRKKLNVEEIESTLESMSTSPVPKSRGKKENLEKIQALLENDDGSVADTNKSRKKKTTKDEVEKVSKPAARGRKKKEVLPSIEAADDIETVPEMKPPVKAVARGRKKKEVLPSIEAADDIETVPEMKPPVKAVARGRKKKETIPAPLEDAIEEPKKVAKKRANTKAKEDADVEADIEQPSPAKKAKPSKSEKTTKKSKKIVKEDEVKPENNVPSNGIATKRGKGKKTAPKDEIEDEPDIEVPEVVEKESRARKRAAAVPIAAVDDESVEDENDDVKPAKVKKTTKTATTKANTTETEYNKTDFELTNKDSNESSSSSEELYNLKISSWNVAGLRSWLKKDGLKFLDYEAPDIFCMQEIKCTTDQLPEEAERIPGYHPYWLCMPGGYAGVAIYSKIMPINVEYGIGNAEFDAVGRIITAEYEKFFLINVYVPNSGRKLVNLEARMRWEQLFQEFIKNLDSRKPIVICGDMNVSHQEIDLANPKANVRNAGFTKEERDKMTELLALGFVDTFRHLYPDRKAAYTYWTYMANARSRNVGWRLDYFITSERFVKRVVDNCIRAQVKGSDHCPITLFLKM